MNNLTKVNNVLLYFHLMLFTFFLNSETIKGQCWNAGWSGAAAQYHGALSSCTYTTIRPANLASTTYNQWDVVYGANYTFIASGGFVSGSTVWTYFEYNGSAWESRQNGTGGTANFTGTINSPAGGGWGLIVFYNNSSCPPTWNAGSSTLQYRVNSQASPVISGNPANITVCAGSAASYTPPTAACNYPVDRIAGPASGAGAANGSVTVTHRARYANGNGGYFSWNAGENNQTIALRACESVYGAGNCSAGACASFTYYFRTAAGHCNCAKAIGELEFIYSNTGHTQVGQEYGGATTTVPIIAAGATTGAGPFVRRKGWSTCAPNSWTLAQPDLRSYGGTSASFTVTGQSTANNPGAISVPAQICVGTATNISNVTVATTGTPASAGPTYHFYYRGGPSNIGWVNYENTTNSFSALPAAVINTPGQWYVARNSSFGCAGQANNSTTLDIPILVNAASTLGTVSNAGPIDFCDASGNFTTAVSVSGQTGSVVWDWGSNNGVWNNNWVAGNSSGICCFPKRITNSDGSADRIRYRVTNANCATVTSGTILIRNRWNEAPTSLTTGTPTICSGASGTITLTANFPNSVNMNGTVEFYANTCGGILVGTANPGVNSSSVAATITAPTATTTYFARYNPGTGLSCSASACVSTIVTVNRPSQAPLQTQATPAGTCGGATTLSVNGTIGNGGNIDYSTWTVGTGGATGFGANGQVSENHRINGTDPWGNNTVIWEARPEGTSNDDGGWNTTNFAVDNTKMYRYSVWVRRTVLGNGNFYLGLNGFGSTDGVITLSSGANNTNPYFWIGDQSQFNQNEWILVVGHVYPHVHTGITNHPQSGRYSPSSGFIGGVANDYKWRPETITARHRAYLYYSSNTATRQQFVYPRVDIVDGSEPSINDLLNGFDVNNGLGSGGTWRWYTGSCGGTLVGSGPTLNVSPSATTNYFVRAEGACNGNTACKNVTVTVNELPTTPSISASSATTFCSGGSTQLTASSSIAGNALSLSGGGPNAGTHVSLGNPPELQITKNLTIEMWIRPTDFSARRNPINKAYAGEYTITQETNGTLNFFWGTDGNNGATYQGFNSLTALTLNQWNHIALVRDINGNQLRWIINGVQTSTAVPSYPSARSGALPVLLGTGYTNGFIGQMDEVRIWNVARTTAEVQNNRFTTIAPGSLGLAGYWRMDEAAGNFTYDASGNSNTGTLQGAPGRLVSTAPLTPTFTWSPATGLNTTTGAVVTASPTTTTTYTVNAASPHGCGNSTNTQLITVNPNRTVGVASSSPTLCISTVMTSITHATTGVTGIGSSTGLPAGVTAAYAANTITISGTPTASGTFNYTITPTGCGSATATGTITVTPNRTVAAASSSPTLCISTAMTSITHATTGVTGIGSSSGLPAGVAAAYAANTITISGTPTASGTFNYTITPTGCGSATATGTITVTPNRTVAAASSSPTLCISTAMTSITHATTGVTGIGSSTGLPAGVTAAYAANTITISGTPTASGTFNYTITPTGCGSATATGTITVTPNRTVAAASSSPTLCISTAMTSITHATTGVTGIGSSSGLPAGVTAAYAANTITISGTPTASGTFNYTITPTGCGSATATGTITVNPLPSAPTNPIHASNCGSGTLNFEAEVGVGETIDWYDAAGGGNLLLSGNTVYSVMVTSNVSYYAQTRNTSTGCVSTARTAVYAVLAPIDKYRSDASGNWTTTSNWEQSCDNGGTWVAATNFPTPSEDVEVRIMSGNTISMNANYTNSTPLNTIVIESGATLNQSAGQNFETATITINGTFVKGTNDNLTGNITVSSTGKYQHDFNGGTIPAATWASGSTLEITGVTNATSIGGMNQAFSNVVFNSNNSSDFEIINSGVITTDDFTVLNTGTAGSVRFTGNATVNVNGDFSIDANNNLVTTGSGLVFNLKGDFNNDGIANFASNLVKFDNSTSNQNISGSSVTTFHNLEIDKGVGLDVVLTEESINVDNELRLTAGNINLNDRGISLGTTGFIANEDETHRIYCNCPDGFIRRVETIGAGYTGNPGNMGLTFGNSGPAMGSTEILRRHRVAGNNSVNPLSINRSYAVSPSSNNGSLDLTLEMRYLNVELHPGASPNDFVYYRTPNGIDWFRIDDNITANPSTKTILVTGWSQFSELGGGNDDNSPLPIKLSKFDLACSDNDNVSITWQTSSEISNDYFTIERSIDGFNYEVLATVNSQAMNGNSNTILNYKYDDKEVPATTVYYRLKQTDFDGSSEIFSPQAIDCNDLEGKEVLMLIPNPARESVRLNVVLRKSDKYVLQVIDNKGANIYKEDINLVEGINNQYLDITNYPSGVYSVILINNNGKYLTKRLVVQK
jgi:hypothetical protein